MPDPLPYDHTHPHGLDTTVGYDVIRSRWSPDPTEPARLEVTAVIDGATRYTEALAAARAHRHQPDQPHQWGYPSARYACGCRAIAAELGPKGTNPAPIFTDLATPAAADR